MKRLQVRLSDCLGMLPRIEPKLHLIRHLGLKIGNLRSLESASSQQGLPSSQKHPSGLKIKYFTQLKLKGIVHTLSTAVIERIAKKKKAVLLSTTENQSSFCNCQSNEVSIVNQTMERMCIIYQELSLYRAPCSSNRQKKMRILMDGGTVMDLHS
jgi:hypothetical protein